jgi:hypothetical protein
MMAKVEGVRAVIRMLKKRAKGMEPASVVVGYEAEYAIYVHEDLNAHHDVGQAKYLEEPARTYARQIRDIIAQRLREGKTLLQALYLGGLFLQRKSQELCPVDLNNLRPSAFTRKE